MPGIDVGAPGRFGGGNGKPGRNGRFGALGPKGGRGLLLFVGISALKVTVGPRGCGLRGLFAAGEGVPYGFQLPLLLTD